MTLVTATMGDQISSRSAFLPYLRLVHLRTSPSPSPPSSSFSRHCCRCNGTAKCLCCACIREGRVCSRCPPGDSGNCHNRDAFQTEPPRLCSSLPLSPCGLTSGAPSCPPLQSSRTPELPSFDLILDLGLSTLRHVLKEARHLWTQVLGDIFQLIYASPSNLQNWKCLFVLPMCVLGNPIKSAYLRWREIQALVKERRRRRRRDEIGDLWADTVILSKQQDLSVHRPNVSPRVGSLGQC